MKLILKLKKRHPSNKIRLGKHMITHAADEYELSAEEMAELKTAGPQAWIMEVKKEVKKPAKKKEDK